MFEHVKWMLIHWMIEHRILAVARVRAQGVRLDARRQYRR